MEKSYILNAIENNQEQIFNNQIFSVTNAKLKKDNIATFNIPAGKTCPFAGKCKAYCYASKGTFLYPNPKKKYEANLQLSLTDKFISVADDSIKSLPHIKFIRIHSSGDFYSKEYIEKWLKLARMHKDRIFYAYTTSIILFKGIELPPNFWLIQSTDTAKDHIYIDYNKTYSKVFNTAQELAEAVSTGKWIDASYSDLNALKGAILNLNVALLKH